MMKKHKMTPRSSDTLIAGDRVTCAYRRDNLGTVLALDDPRAWHGSLAFPKVAKSDNSFTTSGLPDQKKVTRHVKKCLSSGYLKEKAPVYWDFGTCYWDTQLAKIS